MSKSVLRASLAVLVLIATVSSFIYYFIRHPHTFESLRHVSPITLILLFGLYAALMVTLISIQRATLALCDIRLVKRESAIVVMYSTLINFFGPLQSGPGFRGAYLKKKHSVSLKKYTLATLVYYGIYALFNGLLLLSFVLGWWIIVLAIIAVLAAPIALKFEKFRELDLGNVQKLAIATAAQIAVLSCIYFVEIHSLMPGATYLQSLAYTGAANFALFVSITPGAIGFRETFLLFSQHLHHISSKVIATASVVDRSVYIVFLIIMAAILFGMHADSYFKNVRSRSDSKADN